MLQWNTTSSNARIKPILELCMPKNAHAWITLHFFCVQKFKKKKKTDLPTIPIFKPKGETNLLLLGLTSLWCIYPKNMSSLSHVIKMMYILSNQVTKCWKWMNSNMELLLNCNLQRCDRIPWSLSGKWPFGQVTSYGVSSRLSCDQSKG